MKITDKTARAIEQSLRYANLLPVRHPFCREDRVLRYYKYDWLKKRIELTGHYLWICESQGDLNGQPYERWRAIAWARNRKAINVFVLKLKHETSWRAAVTWVETGPVHAPRSYEEERRKTLAEQES